MQVDDDEWTLENFRDAHDPPPLRTAEQLIDEMHGFWMDRHVRLDNVVVRTLEKLGIHPSSQGVFEWEVFEEALGVQLDRVKRLEWILVDCHDVGTGPSKDKITEIACVLNAARDLVLHSSRMLNNLVMNLSPSDTEMTGRSVMLPETVRIKRDEANENVLNPNKDGLTPFQNAFIHLRKVLESVNYRRAGGSYFRRKVTSAGVETLAFEEATTIKDFVSRQCSHDANFKVWKWMTSSMRNQEHMVQYLSESPIRETPDLKENHHLFSYEGDEVGRGSGVYDVASDVFFPYALRDMWSELAQRVTRHRCQLRGDTSYKCEPPPPRDVCVIHLASVFPYDIYAEVKEALPLGLTWREADAFECTKPHERTECPALAEALDATIVEEGEDGEVWGLSWQRLMDSCVLDGKWHELVNAPHIVEKLDNNELHIFARDDLPPGGVVDAHCFVKLSDGGRAVPLLTPARRARAVFSRDEWQTFGARVHAQSFVRHDTLDPLRWTSRAARPGDVPLTHDGLAAKLATVNEDETEVTIAADEWETFGLDLRNDNVVVGGGGRVFAPVVRSRYFRVHTGRTWLDCDAKEIDRIYVCQKFGRHDRFFLYACKGRLFFLVGELDEHQITLMIEGIGGSGKSTVINVQMAYFPHHLRGVLSSNQQPQFGMSAVAHANVCFCAEVSADLQIVQEEWQEGTGGGMLNLAVKFKDPLVVKWKSQFFWVGNAFPKKFKNGQLQVSRRLAGVLMEHAVKPRDGRIMLQIKNKMGSLQRKEILAYHEFLHIQGAVDPMSQPETLPPAFYKYYQRSRRETDPIEAFLSDGSYVTVKFGKHIPMSTFRTLYSNYRVANDMGRPPRWGADVYRTPFNERGIFVVREARYVVNGVEQRNVDVVWNVGLAEDDE